MKRYSTDVVVVGSGAAGMVAALEARERGAEVLLVGKGPTGKGTCTSLAGGMFSSASEGGSPEEHYETTMAVGRGINDACRVEIVAREAKGRIERLVEAGVPLRPVPGGFSVVNRGNARLIPGVPLVESLRKVVADRGVSTRPGLFCLELLVADGRATGVLGIDSDGLPVAISAPSVVLATGGAGALYLRNDNPGGIVGDGYALALQAGLALQDMEFVQFYPLGIAHPGTPATLLYPPYPSEARLLDSAGRDVLRELEGCRSLRDSISRFRDKASLLFHEKHLQGGLFLDLSSVEQKSWESLFPLQLLSRNGHASSRQRLGIAPITHFFIGGVVVNDRAHTALPGLFAAGEVAAGFHGANRLGGNALTECVVCGAIAGAEAAGNARKAGKPAIPSRRIQELVPVWAKGRRGQARLEYGRIRARIRKLAWEQCGIVRDEAGMKLGLELVGQISEDLDRLVPTDSAEGVRHVQARSSLLVLRCVLEASLAREESRGAFFRRDFPETDEARWRRNLSISLDASNGSLLVC